MFEKLDSTKYQFSSTVYNKEFGNILSKIISCYKLMLDNNVILVNDENKIRDVLLIDYLKNNQMRNKLGLTDYLFDKEVPEDTTTGRTDIKIQTQNTFKDTRAYYIIECKRLDAINQKGISGLNAEYIKNGIYRFTSGLYSTFYKTNGMIGLIIASMDIDNNVLDINTLLRNSFSQINTIQELQKRPLRNDFDFSFCSLHKTNPTNKSITLYHLMFDFSSNISYT